MWKYLRIAVTTVSLLVCVLLIALWVRSYFRPEIAIGQMLRSPTIMIASNEGIATFSIYRNSMNAEDGWEVHDVDLVVESSWSLKSNPPVFLLTTTAPHWFYVTITATIAAIPWMKWRFSLRTLLIVMTLFALFFGAIAMSM